MRNLKVKKRFAAVLALLLVMTVFAGCSATDAGYTALYMEASNLESYTVTGDISLEVNPDGMYSYDDPLKVKMNISGNFINTEDDLYLDCLVKFGINDTKMPYSANLLLSDGVLYMPVKDFIDLTVVSFKYQEEYSDKMCAAFKSAFEKEFAANDYVKIADFSAPEEEGMLSYMAMAGGSNAEMTKLVTETIAKMFFDLDSGMTKMTSNGFSLEVTPDKGFAFFEKILKHMSTNKKLIYKEALNLLKTLEKAADSMEMKTMYGYMIEGLEEDEQGFYDNIDYFVSDYENMNEFEKEVMQLALKGSYLKSTISKSGNTYTDDLDMNFTYEGEKMFAMNGQVKMAKATVTKKTVDAKNPVDADSASVAMYEIERKLNPAVSMTLTWWSDANWISADIDRVEGYDYEYFDSVIESGTMYLPMRDVCEWFGEEVTWDNSAKKAYVVRNGVQTEMTGRLEYKTTFVKIRDFEKLGYSVDYEYDKDYREHIVTIKKH